MTVEAPALDEPDADLESVLSPDLARRALSRALRRGGDFAEIYGERRVARAVSSEDGRVDRITGGVQLGVGIRLERDGVSVQSFTEQLAEAAVMAIADAAASALSSGCERSEPRPLEPGSTSPPRPNREFANEERVRLVERADRAAYARDPRIRQVSAFLGTIEQDVIVANSEGRFQSDHRERLRFRVQAVARDGRGRRRGVGSFAPGVTNDLDYLERVTPEEIATRASEQAVGQLDAVPAPAAPMPVVLGNGGGGVLVHEACGHGLEADSITSRASLFAGRVGERVGSPLVTVVDDGALAGGWGSTGIDDEGEPTGRTTLIAEGRLVSFLSDRKHALRLGVRPTGNGRRASFRHLPFPRMTNTFIVPGEATPEEVISETPYGLYARSLSGGQANPTNGTFVFMVREGYLIRRGKIDRPVVGATLLGRSLEVLSAIDLVANDLDVVAANCAREGQRIFVGVGQPTLRVKQLLVGGTVTPESLR